MPERVGPGRAGNPGLARLSIEEAVAALVAAVEPLDEESVEVEDACGRTTATPVVARASVPDVHLAAMDGIAVRASDLLAASPDAPVLLRADRRPGEGGFAWIDTGQALAAGADAVVMVERVEPVAGDGAAASGDGSAGERGEPAAAVRVREAPVPWSNVRVVGEDVVAGERLLPAGHRLSPADLGLLLASGVDRVAVRRRPVVAILPTGDELVEPGAPRPAGTTIESNSRMLAATLRAQGVEVQRLPRVGDDPDALVRAVVDAAGRADVVCTIAGSSAGSRDWTATAFGAVGRVFATGIGLVPGRPTILASLDPQPGRRARVAIGLPGYPIAAAMVAREVLAPLVARLLGEPAAVPATREAFATEAIPTRSHLEELVRVDLARVAGRTVVRPLARGAGALSSLARAGGLVRLRPGASAIGPGSAVAVEDVDGAPAPFTLLFAGLADPALDAFEDALRAHGLAIRIALRPCSDAAAAGLVAAGAVHGCVRVRAARGDATDGPDASAAADASGAVASPGSAIVLDRRASGLVVARGNPLGLAAVADAAREGVRRLPSLKRGGAVAGERALASLEADPARPGGDGCAGAEADEIPPLAAAVLVAAGVADVTLGTARTAEQAGADFVPVRDDEVVLEIESASLEPAVWRAIAEIGASGELRRKTSRPPARG